MLLVGADALDVRFRIGHPDAAMHSMVITESYRRDGENLTLASRTSIVPLAELGETLEGDPASYLLQWLEERIAPPGDLKARVTELNAELARFQLPKSIAPARIELAPVDSSSVAELILHTAGRQTRMAITYRNGQWELETEPR